MTEGQFYRHTCDPPHKGTKELPVLDILDLSHKNGNKTLLATGLDGVHYLIKVQKPTAVPFVVLPDGFLHGRRIRRRLDRTCDRTVFNIDWKDSSTANDEFTGLKS
jgi:hypothetical protein